MKKFIFIAILLILLLIYPTLFSKYSIIILTELLILGMFSMSLDILMGYTGLVSFGHAAYLGVGAYITGFLITKFSSPMIIAILLGSIASGVTAWPIGFISVRSKGLYFAMLTLAFGQFLYTIAYKWKDLTGGDDGMVGIVRYPLFGFLNLDSATNFYYLTLFSLLFLYFICFFLMRSPFGKVLLGIRENEEKVESLGYNTSAYKIMAFVIAGTVAGFAGGLYSTFMGYVSPKIMFWVMSGHVVMMVVIGGIGTLLGPIIGAAIFVLTQHIASTYTENWMLVMGIIFCIFVVFVPRGILGIFKR